MSNTNPLRVPSDDQPTTPLPKAGINTRPGSEDDGWVTPEPVTLADGTRLQLYKDGEGLLAAIELIRGATRRVCLETYILRNDATGRAFAEAMCDRARAGLAVYFIYDSQGCRAASPLIVQMRRAGVRLAEFHPVLPWDLRFSWRPWNRDHRKLLSVDDNVGWIGGLNIGDEYAGPWVAGEEASLHGLLRDQSISLHGPAARVLLHTFVATWRYIRIGGRVRRTLVVHNLSIGPFTKGHRPGKQRGGRRASEPLFRGDFALLASAPTLVSPLRPVLNELLRSAKESITIIMAYFAPDDELIVNLIDAAERGVHVRVILQGASDMPVMQLAARSFYARLMDGGVQIYERNAAIVHAKTLLVDDRIVMIGSTNLDYRSTELNLEASALIDHAEFGRQVRRLLDHDVRFSTQIMPDAWRARPFLDRVVQWAVSRARYLL